MRRLWQACSVPNDPTALELLRASSLMPDGPVTWGQPVRSRNPGVFVVELPAPLDSAPLDKAAIRTWLERVPSLRLDGEYPTVQELAARLSSFWLPRQRVLYVGRTSKSLNGRVGAAYATRLGDKRPHSGGYWLKTLQGLDQLRVWWAETEAPEEYEDALVALFAEGVPVVDRGTQPAGSPLLPWAVLETVTGDRRETGITDQFAEETDATRAAAAATAKSALAARAKVGAAAARASAGGATTRKPAATRRAGAAKAGKADDATHVTAEGLKGLEDELEELRTVKRPEVILRVKSARELGDLRENADYEAARNEQSFLEGRIRSLEQMIRSAVVIAPDRTGEVTLGSTVRVDIDGDVMTFHIVGSTEADPATGRISNSSPVGRALMGHRTGQEVVAQLPGREVRYRIVEVA
jgi:transcription elongation factor GreA